MCVRVRCLLRVCASEVFTACVCVRGVYCVRVCVRCLLRVCVCEVFTACA